MTINCTRIGLDWGNKTVGIALSVQNLKSVPLPSSPTNNLLPKLQNYIIDYEASELIIGITRGDNFDKILEWGNDLGKKFNIKVFFQEERDSSSEARSLWHSMKVPMKKMENKEHSLSACNILDRYITELGDSD